LHCQDRGSQRRFTVVNVSNRAHIDVRFCSFEGSFSHFWLLVN